MPQHPLESAVETVPDRQPAAWRALRYFNGYRLAIVSLMVILVLWDAPPRPVGEFDGELFRRILWTYAGFSLLAGLACVLRRPAFDVQVVIQVFTDIVAVTLLMHAGGGVASGFGLLLIVVIAGGSILTHGRIAILFAALASIAVLLQQIYMWLNSPQTAAQYPHAGMLGVAFFATALLAYASAKRVRASEALAARQQLDLANLSSLNEHIVQRMQSGIMVLDGGGRVRLLNQAAQQLLGLSAESVYSRVAVVAPELATVLSAWHRSDGRASWLLGLDKSQARVTASLAGLGPDRQSGVLVFLEDAELMTHRAQQLKLAALGRLTASIAHEIRNPLGAISHAGQLLGESSRLDTADRRLIRIIRDNAARLNETIENVQRLSRDRSANPENLALGPWLEAFAEEFVTSHSLPDRSLVWRVKPRELQVQVDPGQLHQVVWNLCKNGLQHAGDAPLLELKAGLSQDTRRPFLEVQDSGPGLEPALGEQVFEPFYTTRSDGTGLGLYISRELCEGNRAQLRYMPSAGGTCFRITFPALDDGFGIDDGTGPFTHETTGADRG